MNKFVGKKLLVLGTNVGSVDIVRYARREGACVYVADYYPTEQSEAKKYCDVPVLMSTSDTQGLVELVRNKKIDGVFAGVSEFNLLQAQKISQLLNLRYYCTPDQWDAIENKAQFRKYCQRFDVPHPHTYYMGKIEGMNCQKIAPQRWPCIVKPVDGSSSNGITICRGPEELKDAITLATGSSKTREFIIEDYFVGEEFSAHYTIINGKAVLSSIDNRYPVSVNSGQVTTVPIARVYPSTFLDEYLRQINERIINLCHYLHLEMGVLFIQGLYNKTDNKFCIFEGGLRSAGEAPYRLIERVNGINYMKCFVDYILLGKVDDYSMQKEDPSFRNHKCCVVSFVSKGGKVGDIRGLEDTVASLNSIVDWECRYPIGSETPCGNTLRQIMLRFILDCSSIEQLAKDIDYINDHVEVLAEDGMSLCLKFDSRLLFD